MERMARVHGRSVGGAQPRRSGPKDGGAGSMRAAMDPFFHLVEQKLEQAERDGAFVNLPGQGRPLVLDDLDGVPAELRASWLLLKGTGFVPPELEARREWLRLEDLLTACADDHERPRLAADARRAALRYRLLVEARGVSQGLPDYRDALLADLQR